MYLFTSCDLSVSMQNLPFTLKLFYLEINLIIKLDFLFLPFLGQGLAPHRRPGMVWNSLCNPNWTQTLVILLPQLPSAGTTGVNYYYTCLRLAFRTFIFSLWNLENLFVFLVLQIPFLNLRYSWGSVECDSFFPVEQTVLLVLVPTLVVPQLPLIPAL